MYPRVIIPGSLALPLVSSMYPIKALSPPDLAIFCDSSADVFVISLMQVAAFYLTKGSISFKHSNIFGKIFESTTTSDNSEECFEIYAKQLQTCLFNKESLWVIKPDKKGTAPELTTSFPSALLCLQISLSALAAILFKVTSGSCIQRTRRLMAPDSATDVARFSSCLGG